MQKLGDVTARVVSDAEHRALLREIRDDLHALAAKCRRANNAGYLVQFGINPQDGTVDGPRFLRQVPVNIEEG